MLRGGGLGSVVLRGGGCLMLWRGLAIVPRALVL